MNILQNDFQFAATELSQISSHVSSMNSSLSSISGTLNSLSTTVSDGFSEISSVLYSIDKTLFKMLDELRHHHMQQYIQNERRNDLLESIDRSLKTPSQTAAEEKYNMGVELLRRGSQQQAIRCFHETIDLNPLHYFAYIRLSELYYFLEKYDYAIDYAIESMSHVEVSKKRMAYSSFVVSKAYFEYHNVNEAIHRLQYALSLDAQAEYHYNLSRYFAKMKMNGDAMKQLEIAIQKDRMYFNFSLFEPLFSSFESDLHQNLAFMKENIRKQMEDAMTKIQAITFPKEILLKKSEFETHPYALVWETGSFSVPRMGLIPGSHDFSYNKVISVLLEEVEKREKELNYIISKMKRCFRKDTFISYCESYDIIETLSKEYSVWVDDFYITLRKCKSNAESYRSKTAREKKAVLQRIAQAEKALAEIEKPGFFAPKPVKEQYKQKKHTANFNVDMYQKRYNNISNEIQHAEKQTEDFQRLSQHFIKVPLPEIKTFLPNKQDTRRLLVSN